MNNIERSRKKGTDTGRLKLVYQRTAEIVMTTDNCGYHFGSQIDSIQLTQHEKKGEWSEKKGLHFLMA